MIKKGCNFVEPGLKANREFSFLEAYLQFLDRFLETIPLKLENTPSIQRNHGNCSNKRCNVIKLLG